MKAEEKSSAFLFLHFSVCGYVQKSVVFYIFMYIKV